MNNEVGCICGRHRWRKPTVKEVDDFIQMLKDNGEWPEVFKAEKRGQKNRPRMKINGRALKHGKQIGIK